MSGLLARIGVGEDRLTAVVHTAGVLDDGVLDGVDASRLAGVARPKTAAALALHELTVGMDLDAFVLFSSAATTLGSPGQGNYAAANAFLDALACQRVAAGLPATSLAWGGWAGGGLADTELVRRRLAHAGMPAMGAAQAVAVLGQAVARRDAMLMVADVDWARFAAAFTAVRPSPLISDLPEAQGLPVLAGGAGRATRGSSWVQQVVGLPVAERQQAVLDLVRAQTAVVLGHASPHEIGATRAFKDLGFDSLTAVELRNRLGAVTGLVLPATLVFDYPTPTTLAEYRGEQLLGIREQAAEGPVQ